MILWAETRRDVGRDVFVSTVCFGKSCIDFYFITFWNSFFCRWCKDLSKAIKCWRIPSREVLFVAVIVKKLENNTVKIISFRFLQVTLNLLLCFWVFKHLVLFTFLQKLKMQQNCVSGECCSLTGCDVQCLSEPGSQLCSAKLNVLWSTLQWGKSYINLRMHIISLLCCWQINTAFLFNPNVNGHQHIIWDLVNEL